MFGKAVILLLVANIFYVHCFPTSGNGDSSEEFNKNGYETQDEIINQERELINEVIKKIEEDRAGLTSLVEEIVVQLYQNHRSKCTDKITLEQEREQNKNAQYDFHYIVDDNVKGGYNEREEHRENGKVVGFYQYDDLNIFRRVEYEADENGYRVISDTQEPSRKRCQELDGTVVTCNIAILG